MDNAEAQGTALQVSRESNRRRIAGQNALTDRPARRQVSAPAHTRVISLIRADEMPIGEPAFPIPAIGHQWPALAGTVIHACNMVCL